MTMQKIRSTVTHVYPKYHYARCVVEEEGEFYGESVTFNLSRWEGFTPPRKGQIALLGDVQKYQNGWRADVASPEVMSPESI